MVLSAGKCCVIGGAGFIGTYLTRLLAASGREVVVLGRHVKPDTALPPGVVYVSGDYADQAVLRGVLAGASEVVDLAYATVPQTSFADPVFDIVANLPASVGLLQEAAAALVRKVVLVSSGGTVYGVAESLPICEDHRTDPISPYGITKLTVEKYAWMFRRVSGLPVVVVRPGNAYGEGQRALSGQGFVATAVNLIIRGSEVELFGAEGTVRDYIHAADIASGIMAALEHGAPGSAYNIGSGTGRSNSDVLKILEPLASRSGFRVQTRILPQRIFDVPVNVLDSRKLEAVSRWRPRVAFEDGISRVWDAALAVCRR